MSCKKYVEVTARFDVDGTVFPLEIHWEDGAKFEIDRILDIRRAASLKAGGAGIRYTCRIRGREKYLWLEETRWFMCLCCFNELVMERIILHSDCFSFYASVECLHHPEIREITSGGRRRYRATAWYHFGEISLPSSFMFLPEKPFGRQNRNVRS